MSRRSATIVGLGAAAGVAALGLVRHRRVHDELATLSGGERTKLETSDGAVLDVHIAGAGSTVVLSHCWTGDMRIWEPVAARLVADGHRVVRYDQRGHASSTVGSAGCDVERLGDDLHELLQHYDVRDAVIAGHSMGGMTTQAFAIDHPEALAERVRALVLVATASGDLARLPLARFAPHVVASPLVQRAVASRRGSVLVRGALGKGASRHAVALTRDTFVATAPSVRLAQLNALSKLDLLEGRKTISVPTTVVVGTRDTMTPPGLARGMAAAIPGARLVTIAGAGHMLPLEATDQIAALIEEAAR
ncbi:MAG: alpha/beta fold hydrolase [Acidimicrobiales bacterium]